MGPINECSKDTSQILINAQLWALMQAFQKIKYICYWFIGLHRQIIIFKCINIIFTCLGHEL